MPIRKLILLLFLPLSINAQIITSIDSTLMDWLLTVMGTYILQQPLEIKY